MAKLGEYISIKHGFAFKGEGITSEDNGVVLVTPGNFAIGGGFKEGKCKFFIGDYPLEYVLSPDDLIVTMTDLSKEMDTLGYSALVPYSKRVYLHNQRIGLVSLNSEAVDKHYLYWFMRTSQYQRTIAGGASGTTVHHTSPSRICNVDVDFPDVATQRKISRILDSIEEKIKKNEEINENLLQQARTLYQSWFVDYKPFNGDRPSDWIYGTIDDLAKEIICGKTPSTKVSEYYGNDIPFITIPDMHGNTYVITTERYLSSYGAESQRKKTLPHNSICVSCIGTAGLVSLTAQESQTNQQINSIIPKEGYSPYFIYLLMETLAVIINNLGQSGSTIVNLNKAQFGKISIIIPTVATIKSFDEIVAPMFESILSNQKENIRLAELRNVLLPRLMSGELDISDLDL